MYENCSVYPCIRIISFTNSVLKVTCYTTVEYCTLVMKNSKNIYDKTFMDRYIDRLLNEVINDFHLLLEREIKNISY